MVLAEQNLIRIVHEGGQELIERGLFANLGEVVDDWSRHLGADGRLITGISVDERVLEGSELDDTKAIDLASIDEIRFEIRTIVEVAIDSVASCADYSESIVQVIMGLVDSLRMGRIEDANDQLAPLSDSLSVLMGVLASAGRALGEDGEPLLALGPDLMPWLEQIVEAQATFDWVRVADFLEYEVIPILRKWHDTMLKTHSELSAGRKTERPAE